MPSLQPLFVVGGCLFGLVVVVRDANALTPHVQVMEMVDRVLARGMGLDRNEVRLRNRLEAIRERLNRPTEFKARLNELMALQRVHGERRRQRTAFAPGDLRAILDVRCCLLLAVVILAFCVLCNRDSWRCWCPQQ